EQHGVEAVDVRGRQLGRLHPAAQVRPEPVEVDGAGEPPGHADDGDGLARSEVVHAYRPNLVRGSEVRRAVRSRLAHPTLAAATGLTSPSCGRAAGDA